MAAVTVTCDNGRPVEELAKLIDLRSKWLKQTAEQSCTACMMDMLVSLRALTKTARPKKNEIKLQSTALTVSWKRVGGKNVPILRNGGAEYTPQSGESILWDRDHVTQYRLCKVWRWKDYKQTYLIVALNQSHAKERAMQKVHRRVERYGGLARTAISLLLKKTGSKPDPTKASPRASDKANRLTFVTKSGNGNTFNIKADDLLDYAKLAFKVDGDSAMNQAMMKACNKVTGLINQKCKDLLTFKKLDTPFPEVARK